MLQHVSEAEWERLLFPTPEYLFKVGIQTDEAYALFFAKCLKKVCDYKVVVGVREHINYLKRDEEYYEDRDHWFIDLSLRSFIKALDYEHEKYLCHKYVVRIRNMAIEQLTIHLQR